MMAMPFPRRRDDTEATLDPLPTEDRSRLHGEIRALMAEAGVAAEVARRLDAGLARQAPSTVPKWIADFLRGEAGALAHVLPRHPARPAPQRRGHHGL